MAHTKITPFCVTRDADHAAFAPLHDIFTTPAAQRVGLQAIAQCYTVSGGTAKPHGDPVFLTIDPETGDPVPLAAHHHNSLHDLKMAFEAAKAHQALETDMLYVTSHRLWLMVFPRVLVMQAEDVVVEMRAASTIAKNVEQSTWARAALACLRLAPPISAHDTIVVLRAIPQALDLLTRFRPDTQEAVRLYGFTLGPFMPADLAVAIAAA